MSPETEIRANIQAELDEIERTQGVKILHCIESGSRAWGFASPDSDYDVRFIYVRQPADYLRLEQTRDVIEWKLNDVYDINGWDVQKALRLLHSSNPTLFEWSNSPVIYRTTPEWDKVRAIENAFFLSKSGMYHYLHMAKTNYREYLRTEEVRLKKYFYVLRPLLACQWILDKHLPPPMAFAELAEAELAPELRPIIETLLQRKMQTPELGMGKRIPELNAYMEQQLVTLNEAAAALPAEPKQGWELLNNVFLELLRK